MDKKSSGTVTQWNITWLIRKKKINNTYYTQIFQIIKVGKHVLTDFIRAALPW